MLLHVYYCLSHLCILFVWFVWVLLCSYVECHRPTCNQPFRIMYNGVKTTILPIGTSIIFNCWVLWPFPALIWFGYGCLCLHAHIDIYLCCLNGLNFRALASALEKNPATLLELVLKNLKPLLCEGPLAVESAPLVPFVRCKAHHFRLLVLQSCNGFKPGPEWPKVHQWSSVSPPLNP